MDEVRPLPPSELELKIKLLSPDAEVPEYATEGSGAFDLKSIQSGFVDGEKTCPFKTGLAMAIPKGYVGLIFPRSGLGTKFRITLTNGTGVVDSDYRGEVIVHLRNDDKSPYYVKKGDRIAQMVIVPAFKCRLTVVKDLDETVRGMGGFGHTGA